jgi:hypothetical protein
MLHAYGSTACTPQTSRDQPQLQQHEQLKNSASAQHMQTARQRMRSRHIIHELQAT